MDRETRNGIQRATQDARTLLEREYAEQLAGTFDIRLDGTIATTPGGHLDAGQRLVRSKLVTAVEHLRAAGHGKDAVVAYVREAAFTTLNRFVALKMLEARGLAQECLSRGEESSGFKEFVGLAPGLVQLPDHGYRLYIESLFDEIGREVRVLFDRRDPANLLWPRRQPLLDVLAILNAAELASVWGEDETIGWVYQYFNSDEERRQMRAESQAPRNSRELAVRNQFFTPRYVVQFLTDNTLGRIWYEMRRGDTKLRDLDYFVRRPNEIFLAQGEEPPAASDGNDDLSKEELLRRPFYVPFRAKKDPRDIRVLDPACGSGHFLLYAFDLLLVIYEEAWSDETLPKSEVTGRALREEYADIATLRGAVPGLILRHNLHGIDIDARCAQIAAFALWMRAQRAFKDLGFARDARPPVQKTNIVVAEPMPGEADLQREFIATLDSKLGQLVKHVFDHMALAGDAGSLLRLEDDIRDTIRNLHGQHGPLFRASDERRWQRAERDVLEALRSYANYAANGRAFQRRLFAEDAARGLGLLDVCVRRFDAILMNPPFGSCSIAAQQYVDRAYPDARQDLLAAFVSRAKALAPEGLIGSITNRTCLFITSLSSWRRRCLLDDRGLFLLVDLGHGVLDGALVEATCYVLGSSGYGLAFTTLSDQRKDAALAEALNDLFSCFVLDNAKLSAFPNAAISYWAPPRLLSSALRARTCEQAGLLPRVGLQTSDDFRFLRLQWEVPQALVGEHGWVPFAKGGEYSPFADNLHLAVNWFNDAAEQRAFAVQHAQHTGSSRGNDATREFEWYFKEGLTYSERTTSDISVRVLPRGCIIGTSGPGIFSEDRDSILPALAYFCTATFRQLLELSIGSGDAVTSGSAARHYTVGNLARCPVPSWGESVKTILGAAAKQCVAATRSLLACSLTASGPIRAYAIHRCSGTPLSELSMKEGARRLEAIKALLDTTAVIETEVALAFGSESGVADFVDANAMIHPCRRPRRSLNPEEVCALLRLDEEAIVDRVAAERGSSRAISKKTWYADRKVELACVYFDAHPASVISAAICGQYSNYPVEEAAAQLVHEAIAVAFGDIPAGRLSATHNGPNDLFADGWGRAIRVVSDDAPTTLTDDAGHDADLSGRVLTGVRVVGWQDPDIPQELCRILNVGSIREYLRRCAFSFHIAAFSRSRRKAPIYWQLATPSASYSVWLYYHRFTRDTLYRVLNDYVTPKLKHEERKLVGLTHEAGPNPSASQRREIDAQEGFVDELRALREEVARVAPIWNPDLNDGVIINFAPVWRLVPQNRSWQKECKAVWDNLVAGEYDWTHLAMHLWPERVVPKCAADRSLAIAHGLEGVFWEEGAEGQWKPKRVAKEVIDRLIAARASAAVKAALNDLLRAPAPTATSGGWRRSGGRRAEANGGMVAVSRSRGKASAAESSADKATIAAVRDAIAAVNGGASKAEVMEATGISSSDWNAAINALLAQGAVIRTGAARGTRYQLAAEEETV